MRSRAADEAVQFAPLRVDAAVLPVDVAEQQRHRSDCEPTWIRSAAPLVCEWAETPSASEDRLLVAHPLPLVPRLLSIASRGSIDRLSAVRLHVWEHSIRFVLCSDTREEQAPLRRSRFNGCPGFSPLPRQSGSVQSQLCFLLECTMTGEAAIPKNRLDLREIFDVFISPDL